MDEQQYPQLRKPEFSNDVDSDEYEFAKREAIEKSSEKEYLNAIVRLLRTHSSALGGIQFYLLAIVVIFLYFLVKDIYRYF
jgi:hypothetical protein